MSGMTEIQEAIKALPPTERCALTAWLASAVAREPDERTLEIMAADPEIQRELGRINAEFMVTEADGLGDTNADSSR